MFANSLLSSLAIVFNVEFLRSCPFSTAKWSIKVLSNACCWSLGYIFLLCSSKRAKFSDCTLSKNDLWFSKDSPPKTSDNKALFLPAPMSNIWLTVSLSDNLASCFEIFSPKSSNIPLPFPAKDLSCNFPGEIVFLTPVTGSIPINLLICSTVIFSFNTLGGSPAAVSTLPVFSLILKPRSINSFFVGSW